MKMQTSTVENFMEVVQGRNVTQMASLIQELVESQVFGDGVTGEAASGEIKLDSDITTALKTIKQLLIGDIQNALKHEHHVDQKAVNILHECWDSCKSAHDEDQKQVNELWGMMQSSKTQHEVCREDVHKKYVDKVIKCNALDLWIESLECPACYKEECVVIHDPSSRKVGDALRDHIEWARNSYEEWSVKHAACSKAVKAHTEADTTCDRTQGGFESNTCAHRQAVWTACNVNQQSCCKRCSIEFDAEVNRVECAEKDRKIDWSATKKIECFIDIIMASPTDEELQARCKKDGKACISQWREAEYNKCSEVCVDIDFEAGDYYLVDGVNTTHRTDSSHGDRCTLHLDIHFPMMPSCVNCPPPIPGPCEFAFIHTYYEDYDSTEEVPELDDEKACKPDKHEQWWAYSRAECRPCPALVGRCPNSNPSCFFGNQVRIFATDKSVGYLNLGEVIVNGGASAKVTLSDSWSAPHLKDNCVDGDPNTFCHSKHAHGWWVAFTLDEPTCINSITVLNRHNGWHERIVGSGISIINQGTEIWTETFETKMQKYHWDLVDGSSGKVNLANALVIDTKQNMLDAGWTWTGCSTGHHGGDSLANGIWCHSEEQMKLRVPMTGGPSWCTATWMNNYGGGGGNGFVRLMKNGVQMGQATQNQQASATFEYRAGDLIEIWEGFAIAKVSPDWLQCGPKPPVDVSAALVIGNKDQMFAAGWDWTGCAHNDHGGSHLQGGIWCHSQKQMHLKIPMRGGPSTCTATWRNDYSNSGADGFVRLMKNGHQIGEARASSDKSVTFDYVPGDQLEFWEGFAIIKVQSDWLQCENKGPWNLVFRETNGFWFKKNQYSLNANEPNNDNFAILDQLENFRQNGAFEFKLVWPNNGLADQHWSQTSNPVTDGIIKGYKAIKAPHSSNGWGGLEKGGTYSLLDGTVNHGNWYYSVGSFQSWRGGIPGPSAAVSKVELYARGVEDIWAPVFVQR
jgi:hypothetical protein